MKEMKKKKLKKKIPFKIGKRYFKIYDSIFGRKVHVLLNYEPKDYEKWLNKMKVADIEKESFYENFAGMSIEIEASNGQTEMIIWVRNFNWVIKCQGTLIHEITHTIVKLFAQNKIPFTVETQEFFAQMISRMYEDIAHHLVPK